MRTFIEPVVSLKGCRKREGGPGRECAFEGMKTETLSHPTSRRQAGAWWGTVAHILSAGVDKQPLLH